MSTQKYISGTPSDISYLRPPPGRRYVRSFLFSRHVDAPLARVHLLTRALLVICLSLVQLRAMNTAHPDPLGALVLLVPSIVIFLCSGMKAQAARVYVLLTIPTLLCLLISWTVLNPVAGHTILAPTQVYGGYLLISLSVWQLLWLVIALAYYWWKRSISGAIVVSSVLTFLVTRFVSFPMLVLTQVPLFHPLTVSVSDQGLILAGTKMAAYLGMLLTSMALVVSSRDVELIGALRQLRLPQPIIFFLSTVFRALNLALSDYETIHQAQVARAINARPRSFFHRLFDFASVAIPMVAMMIRRSSEIGDALLARGYKLRQQNVDFHETSPLRWLDGVLLFLCLILVLLAVSPLPGLTALVQGVR